jgi:hypothetical protein
VLEKEFRMEGKIMVLQLFAIMGAGLRSVYDDRVEASLAKCDMLQEPKFKT